MGVRFGFAVLRGEVDGLLTGVFLSDEILLGGGLDSVDVSVCGLSIREWIG
jgi:hypothetical protein